MKKIIIICDECKKQIYDMTWEAKGEQDYHLSCYKKITALTGSQDGGKK